jgi:hypothetical protein
MRFVGTTSFRGGEARELRLKLYNANTLASGDEFPMNLVAMQDFLMSLCQVWEADFREDPY